MLHLAKRKRWGILAVVVALAGCALPSRVPPPAAVQPTSRAQSPIPNSRDAQPASSAPLPASPVSYQVPVDDALPDPPKSSDAAVSPEPPNRPSDASDQFAGQAELSGEQLVAEVQARNPSLQAATAAWQAAAERYPQMVSLEDPMFGFMISPSGAGRDDGGGWMVEASQKIPWAGKRDLRGCAAAAEADAMQGDIGEARLRLAEAARMAFFDYYLAARLTEVNANTRQLLKQMREIARTKYEVNQATQQDVLQADVELAMLDSRQTELSRDARVAAARINTLLHRLPDCPLPPPPAKAPVSDSLPGADVLQQRAAESRPDLFATAARIRTEQANLGLACKEYYPDFNLRAKYDAFMPEDMRAQVGMDVNVPLGFARRAAAVREASDRIAQRRAEYQDRLDQARYEVQSSLERVLQSQRVVGLYQERILPAAERSLQSAQVNYTSGKLDFLRLIDAERQLNSQREMYYQAIAEYNRRLAELERAVGEPVCARP